MVKRPKSPDILEDSRLFTVYQPYPLNANWQFEEDQSACARWATECIGLESLWVLYYKPSARGMILLEISKNFKDHGVLLGEHRWAEFLKNPTAEDKERTTRVFHSFYTTVREAQKDGWKEIPIKQSWLKNWVPGKELICTPYPQTHWCHVPAEDRTNKILCRPLPVEQKLPPPRAAPVPVVGSQAWIEQQQEERPTTATLTNAWSEKVAPPLDIVYARASPSTSSRALDLPPQSARSTNGPPTPASASNTAPPSASNRKPNRSKPQPLKNFISTASATIPREKSHPSWAQVQKSPSVGNGAKSPLLEPEPTTPVNAWKTPIKIAPAPKVVRASSALPPVGMAPSNESWFDMVTAEDMDKGGTTPGSSNSPSPSPGPIMTPAVPAPDVPAPAKKKQKSAAAKPPAIVKPSPQPRLATSTPAASASTVKSTPVPASTGTTIATVKKGKGKSKQGKVLLLDIADVIEQDVEGEGDPYEEDGVDILSPYERKLGLGGDTTGARYGSLVAGETSVNTKNADGEEQNDQNNVEFKNIDWDSLWSNEDHGRKKPPELICPTHNIACKKGICQDMAAILRSRKREEEKKTWGTKTRGRGKNQNENSQRSDTTTTDNETTTANETETDPDGFQAARKPARGRGTGRG